MGRFNVRDAGLPDTELISLGWDSSKDSFYIQHYTKESPSEPSVSVGTTFGEIPNFAKLSEHYKSISEGREIPPRAVEAILLDQEKQQQSIARRYVEFLQEEKRFPGFISRFQARTPGEGIAELYFGYDGIRDTFYAQVFREEDSLHPSLWIGKSYRQITTANELAETLKQAGIEVNITNKDIYYLEQDKADIEKVVVERTKLYEQQELKEQQQQQKQLEQSQDHSR